MDEVRNRFLQDRVMTATPAQRVVMLFDRLATDLRLAGAASDAIAAGTHLGHATSIVAELYGSLDINAGGPSQNLATLYGYLLSELTAIRGNGKRDRLPGICDIVTGLRDAFAEAAATLASSAALAATASTVSTAFGAPSRTSAGFGAPSRTSSATAWVG